MPRIPRIAVPGVALHMVQRGNNRQAVFFRDADYVSYLNRLFESAERYEVSVHAFVCMTNHVHILLTPWCDGSASRMMQRLGASYTAGINSVYRRTGSLWEGRFKSSLVDSERYVLACYRYIELNPVRAGMVAIHPNAGGRAIDITPLHWASTRFVRTRNCWHWRQTRKCGADALVKESEPFSSLGLE